MRPYITRVRFGWAAFQALGRVLSSPPCLPVCVLCSGETTFESQSLSVTPNKLLFITRAHPCTHMCTPMHTHVHMHTHLLTHTQLYTHMHMHAPHMHTCSHTHPHAHVYITHTCTRAHTVSGWHTLRLAKGLLCVGLGMEVEFSEEPPFEWFGVFTGY